MKWLSEIDFGGSSKQVRRRSLTSSVVVSYGSRQTFPVLSQDFQSDRHETLRKKRYPPERNHNSGRRKCSLENQLAKPNDSYSSLTPSCSSANCMPNTDLLCSPVVDNSFIKQIKFEIPLTPEKKSTEETLLSATSPDLFALNSSPEDIKTPELKRQNLSRPSGFLNRTPERSDYFTLSPLPLTCPPEDYFPNIRTRSSTQLSSESLLETDPPVLPLVPGHNIISTPDLFLDESDSSNSAHTVVDSEQTLFGDLGENVSQNEEDVGEIIDDKFKGQVVKGDEMLEKIHMFEQSFGASERFEPFTIATCGTQSQNQNIMERPLSPVMIVCSAYTQKDHDQRLSQQALNEDITVSQVKTPPSVKLIYSTSDSLINRQNDDEPKESEQIKKLSKMGELLRKSLHSARSDLAMWKCEGLPQKAVMKLAVQARTTQWGVHCTSACNIGTKECVTILDGEAFGRRRLRIRDFTVKDQKVAKEVVAVYHPLSIFKSSLNGKILLAPRYYRESSCN